MPERSVLPFVVRRYELDAAGRVLPPTYLRWFQEAAIFASAANGFDEARYQELGSTWFVREFHVEVLASPQPGDAVEVFTWASGFQRVVAHRQYRAQRPGGEVMARGEAEWVYVDRETGRPRRIDRDPMADFPVRAEHVFADRTWGAQRLDAQPPDRGADRREHTVRWSELDAARHVNNAVYAEWVLDHLAGFREGSGTVGPGSVKRLRLQFVRGARGGQRLEWLLWQEGDGLWVHRVRLADGGDAVTRAVLLAHDDPLPRPGTG